MAQICPRGGAKRWTDRSVAAFAYSISTSADRTLSTQVCFARALLATISSLRTWVSNGGFVESKLSLPIGGTTKSFSVPQAVSAVELLPLK